MLEEVNSTIYIGLEIDTFLKWDVHVKRLSRIILMNLATLSRSWSFLNQNELSTIYKTKV